MERKVTRAETRELLRKRLGEDNCWALRALQLVYNLQTVAEQTAGVAHEPNGAGFTRTDAGILTSFAQQMEQRGFLTPKQMAVLKKRMPKYWRQIEREGNPEKIRAEVLRERKERLKKANAESTLFATVCKEQRDEKPERYRNGRCN